MLLLNFRAENVESNRTHTHYKENIQYINIYFEWYQKIKMNDTWKTKTFPSLCTYIDTAFFNSNQQTNEINDEAFYFLESKLWKCKRFTLIQIHAQQVQPWLSCAFRTLLYLKTNKFLFWKFMKLSLNRYIEINKVGYVFKHRASDYILSRFFKYVF